jgi:thiamine biosynthesis lipoprotein
VTASGVSRRQIEFRALGSDVFVTLVGDDSTFSDIFTNVQQKIDDFEKRFSRFLPTSELSLFNNSAGTSVNISHEFRRILLASQKMSKLTGGLFNPLILPNLQRSGYKGSWPHPEKFDKTVDYSDRNIVDFTELELVDGSAKIPKNTALDLGGIGKGFLLDTVSKWLQKQNLTGFWMSLGGDIVCVGHDVGGEPWQVDVASAEETSVATVIEQQDERPLFVATSGITKRRGKGWHHLIDPRTGQPAETNILTATVVARSGVDADVLAKSIVIAGKSFARTMKTTGKIERALLQYDDQTKEEI